MNCSPELRSPPGRPFGRHNVWSTNRHQPRAVNAEGGWSGPRSLNFVNSTGDDADVRHQRGWNETSMAAEAAAWDYPARRRLPVRHESILTAGPRSLRWTMVEPPLPPRPDEAASIRLWGGQPTMVAYSR
jgi:hypothetical protein